MRTIRKRIVTDENSRPVAVQIDYEDWLEIERLLGLQSEKKKPTDLSRYRGIWKGVDGLEYQRRIREEWDDR